MSQKINGRFNSSKIFGFDFPTLKNRGTYFIKFLGQRKR